MPKYEVETKFYTEGQNNSGGYFIDNEDVGHYVIIEAENAEQAEKKLNEIVEGYSEYCDCCGERWNAYWTADSGTTEPTIYGEPVAEYHSMWGGHAVIYYYDGTKKRIKLGGNEVSE